MRINFIRVVHAKYTRRRHVYSDLQPYICLWENCSLGRRMFSTRHEWLQHEQDYHGKIWSCSLGCPDSFDNRHTIENHYLSHHIAQSNDIEKMLQASETQRPKSEPYECPLCSAVVSTTKAYGKHAGRHLRELSLFALPAYATEEIAELNERDGRSERESVLADDESVTSSERGSVVLENPADIPIQPSGLSQHREWVRGVKYPPSDRESNVGFQDTLEFQKLRKEVELRLR